MNPELVDGTALNSLAERNEMRGLLPHLVRRLLSAVPGVNGLVVPAEEGIGAAGFDGVVEAGAGNAWAPPGASVWEMGAGADPRAKAEADYKTRTEDPKDADPAATAFVFVTPRRWAAGQDWARERKADGPWRDVVVIDGEGLYAWVETAPDIHVWLSERLGQRPLSIRTLSSRFDQVASRTRPRLPTALLLAGREKEAEELRNALAGGAVAVAVQGTSREEALMFIGAALGLGDIDQNLAPDQPLWARDVDAFERLALSERPMTLLATIDGVEPGDALAHGHRVLQALGAGDYAEVGANVIKLARPDRDRAREALIHASVPFREAERLAGLSRTSLVALIREMAPVPAGARPSWARGPDAGILAALLLVGAWTAEEGDTEILQLVTGLNAREIEMRLVPLSRTDDPPWTLSGGVWHVVSPDDSFALVSGLLDDTVLERWRVASLKVFEEVDPRLGMDAGERAMADFRKEAKSRFSASLRHGLAQAAALLGARGQQPLPSGVHPARFASRLTKELLLVANRDLTGRVWASVSPLLPRLAEAAPDAVLECVRAGLEQEPSPVLGLFRSSDRGAILGPTSPSVGLLWALDCVASASEFLLRSVLLLAQLADQVPQDTEAKPLTSLTTILLPWHPSTDADAQGRLAAIDAVREAYPEVGWRLLVALLPGHAALGGPISVARFREWGSDGGYASRQESIEITHELAIRAIDDAPGDSSRWLDLLPHAYGLEAGDRQLALTRLAAVSRDELSDPVRRAIWKLLVDEANRHLRFPEAHWSLAPHEAEQFLEVGELFADSGIPEQHARLFDERAQHAELANATSFEGYQEALDERRSAAAQEVMEQSGISGLIRLAEVSEQPYLVGRAAAAHADDLAAELLPLLGGEGPATAMAAGWARRRIEADGLGWAKTALRTLDLDRPSIGALTQLLPATDDAFDLVESLGDEVAAQFWKTFRPFGVHGPAARRAVTALLTAERPWVAIDLMATVDVLAEGLDLDLVREVLEAAARSDQVDAVVHAAWEVGQLLDLLEENHYSREKLAGLEFAYFMVLDDLRPARALEMTIAEDPTLFVKLIRYAFVRANGEDDPDARSELAPVAWQVLRSVKTLPGQGDEAIDGERLDDWIDRARAELGALDRAEVGDIKLGEFLSQSRAGRDGIWPAEAVRDAVERLRSDAIERGLLIGRFNHRGVTVRGMHDGGLQERELAAGLRLDADQLGARWPRVATCLRAMADQYEADARQHDRDAQRRADQA